MGVVEAMHDMYEKALRVAFERGDLEIDCERKERALELRVQFYTYIRYLERAAKNRNLPLDEQKKVRELLSMRQELSFKAYRNGVLRIKKTDYSKVSAALRAALVNDEASKPSLASVQSEFDEIDNGMWEGRKE